MTPLSNTGWSASVRRHGRAIAALLAMTAIAACASGPPDVSLAPGWPERVDEYREVQRAWTRHAVLRKDYQQVIEVYATFKSPAWRAAYVQRQARSASLPADEKALLAESEQMAAREGPYEFELLVTTYDFRENDLDRGERSVWRVSLIDDMGNQVTAGSIVRDKRPQAVIRAEFPDMGDFATAYIVRFPRTIEVLRPDARAMRLELASPRGAVTLTWSNGQP